jgi:hypothetical protein
VEEVEMYCLGVERPVMVEEDSGSHIVFVVVGSLGRLAMEEADILLDVSLCVRVFG